jgi:hypothetical protein
MSFSTASKLAALGEFAEPRVWWGRRPLYTRDDLRQWVEARSRPTKQPVVEDKSRNGRELQCTEVQTLAMSPRAAVQSPGVVGASTTRSTADQHCIHKTEVAEIATCKGEAE